MWRILENGKPGLIVSGRSLVLSLGFEWSGREAVETAAVEMWIDCMGISSFWPVQRHILGPQELASPGHGPVYQQFPVATDARRIAEIEDKRRGGGPVTFEVHCNVYYRNVQTFPLAGSSSGPVSIRALGPPLVQSVGLQIVAERDPWLRILAGLNWGETEIFELPAAPFRGHDRLRAALEHLRACEDAMRLGQWPSAATEARKAVEVAAATNGTMDAAARRQAFESLVSDIFPEEAEAARRDTARNLMMALVPLRNEGGAHGSTRFQIERFDAETSFRVATALFRYMGLRLVQG